MAALAMTGANPPHADAREPMLPAPAGAAVPSPQPVMHGPRSGRVLGLLLTLEALRAAPALLDRSQV